MRRLLGIFLASWSGGFGLVHLAWAAGWRGFLPDEFGSIFDRWWFWAYDVAAGLLMIAAAWVAWRLAHAAPTRALRIATLIGSGLALLRGIPALAADLVASNLAGIGFFADLWFTIAGLAGVALFHATRPRQAS